MARAIDLGGVPEPEPDPEPTTPAAKPKPAFDLRAPSGPERDDLFVQMVNEAAQAGNATWQLWLQTHGSAPTPPTTRDMRVQDTGGLTLGLVAVPIQWDAEALTRARWAFYDPVADAWRLSVHPGFGSPTDVVFRIHYNSSWDTGYGLIYDGPPQLLEAIPAFHR